MGKSLQLDKSWSSRRLMKEFSQKGGPEPTLTDSSKKIDAHGTTDTRLGSGRPKSFRTTDSIAVVQDLICSQDDACHTSVLCGTLYRTVPFNCVKFAAEYLL